MTTKTTITRWLAGFAVETGEHKLEGLYPTYIEAKQCAEFVSGCNFPPDWRPEFYSS